MITAPMGRSNASTITSRTPPPFEPRQRAWRIVAKRCVLAAGAIERPLVFGNNDRPGVMLAGAVRSLSQPLRREAGPTRRRLRQQRRCGRRHRRPCTRRASRSRRSSIPGPRPSLRARRLPKRPARASSRAASSRAPSAGTPCARSRSASSMADRAASPAISSPCQAASARICIWRRISAGVPCGTRRSRDSCPATTPRGMAVAGAARGTYDLADCLAAGARAGAEAAEAVGFQTRPATVPQVEPQSVAVTPLWRVRGHKGKAFIDFQNDVTDKDVELAEREGFRSVEHLKRYTTLGMATDQGKTANVNGLAVMAEITERSIPQTGVTTFRPPFTPVAIGALAGHARGKEHRPTRLTPSHEWAQAARRRLRGIGPVAARPIFPAGRRPELVRRLQPRSHRGAFARRRLRRLDARQDRHPGRRCRRVPRARLLQFVEIACRSARSATASCCARTASSSTTARRRASAPIITS